ncbi:transketolase [Actinospica durhamensis]|uniref:Transketolase n=1 Tax=Actinospica durhamensis TaxID=1508375 RepID=A0A941EI87_9ACTN|nr:transketolase [Actinospica durhamensis]MBR7831856.1 transketolase [Actinospica durhamensis]
MTNDSSRQTLTPTADAAALRELAGQLRADSIRCSTSAGSGHPSSSMSAADLLAVLVTRHLRYDWDDPHSAANDHLIFSKGHASPLLYSVYKAVGVVEDEELMTTYRRHGHRLQGHPTPILPWVDVATGSLGQGLPYGVGVAWAASRLDHSDAHVWVLCGDSELAEGSIWEAFDRASSAGIADITAIVDVNRLGQRGATAHGWDLEGYRRKAEAFGWEAVVIDGHDVEQVDKALARARESDRPFAILAKTVKGKGFSEIEDSPSWHGKPLPAEMAERALAELGASGDIRVRGPLPEPSEVRQVAAGGAVVQLPRWDQGEKVATRRAYGDALAALGADPRVVALDAEVSNSTYAELFAKQYPDRFFEAFIAEQQLVAAAVGVAVRGYAPFASTFAAFFARASDFIRMTGISGTSIRLVGSHAGVEIGPDGPSQMALEDIASLRAIHGSTVLYPADATSTAALAAVMVELAGVSYLRITRGAYPVLYPHGESFEVGGSKTLISSGQDQVTLIGAGVTVYEALAAAQVLADEEGIAARVIDLYSVKPVDAATLVRAASETGRIVVAEDHYPEGGLASAVLESLAAHDAPAAVRSLAVRSLPGSGEPHETLDAAGISATHIVAAARALVHG